MITVYNCNKKQIEGKMQFKFSYIINKLTLDLYFAFPEVRFCPIYCQYKYLMDKDNKTYKAIIVIVNML